jgi:predicted methyltransferase
MLYLEKYLDDIFNIIKPDGIMGHVPGQPVNLLLYYGLDVKSYWAKHPFRKTY